MFHPLKTDIEAPRLFNNPFWYTPHPLAVLAADEVRQYVGNHDVLNSDAQQGKMFGVLVCKKEHEIGYVAAYSGLLAGRNDWPFFVPPVFDAQQPDGHFKQTEREISAINHQLKSLSADTPEAQALKAQRKTMSETLQRWLFDQYQMLNARGERKSLIPIWRDYHQSARLRERFPLPPGGSGDCCAPKLLQYVYEQNLTPLCMAEFWMGQSPKGEVRHDGEYYPACRGKCKPILTHMLQGLDVEADSQWPAQSEGTLASAITILYDDPDILVLCKPAGMLSVPGKDERPSVLSWVESHYRTEGPVIVHRLDMDTSGLLVVAKTTAAYHHLQTQFLQQRVKKRYEAVVEGCLPVGQKGQISLPMRPDPLDRPRQVVDAEHGKRAVTDYEVVATDGHTSRLNLWPQTGRTHQLRLHCAHADGLAAPIVGDNLYGHHSPTRLHLHAAELSFVHPTTEELLHFTADCDF